MLLVNGGQHCFDAHHEPMDRSTNFAQIEGDWALSDNTNPFSSNNSSEGSLLMLESAQAQKGEVAVWVDIWNPRLPILKCTVAFTCLSGPSSGEAYFIDWVEQREEFYQWVQLQMNQLASEMSHSRDKPFRLRLRPPGAAGDMLQFRALCFLEVVLCEGMDDGASNEIMAKLCLRNITHCRRKKNRIGGRQPPPNRVCNTGNVNASPVTHTQFSNSKVWLDVHSNRLHILDYTLSYAATLGAGALGMNFLDWVVDEERFQEWVLSHHQIHLEIGIQLHRLNQVVLRDPRIKEKVIVVDCVIHSETTCWPESLETQSLIAACVEMRIAGHVEVSLKQALDKHDARTEKGSSTNMSL